MCVQHRIKNHFPTMDALLLPELWNEILNWLKIAMVEDAYARARCRAVCRAWHARDPDFIVPMAPGLAPLFPSLSKIPAIIRDPFSCLLAHLTMVLPVGFKLQRIYVMRERELDVDVISPWFHTMRIILEWPEIKSRFYPGRLCSFMDWVYAACYAWSDFDFLLAAAIRNYERERRAFYRIATQAILPPCFSFDDELE
jgi:hypothetical protein